MSKFERGIKNQLFIDELNQQRMVAGSFWQQIVNDNSLFIAIRKESINVYYKGNSLVRIIYDNGLRCYTHYKFIINPDYKNAYIESNGNGGFIVQNPSKMLINSLREISLIKKAIKAYSGEEKSGVHNISCIASDVIDVEIAFSGNNGLTATKDRIDFLRLKEYNNELHLVFYEAKHYTNKEIRAKVATNIPVVKQLGKYQNCIISHQSEIIASYRLVCKNLVDLGLTTNRPLTKKVDAGMQLYVDSNPTLVIFGYDEDQRNGNIYKNKMNQLKSQITGPVIAKGNATSFKVF